MYTITLLRKYILSPSVWLLGLLFSWLQIWEGSTLAVLKPQVSWIQGHTASKDKGSGLQAQTNCENSSITDTC